MATIIIKNSTGSGAVPASLTQGELAINTVDGKLFYGSGSGNVVKEFTGSGGGSGGGFPYTGSAIISGSLTVTGSFFVSRSIDTYTKDLIDNTGVYSLNWQQRDLFDGSNVVSIDWDDRKSKDSAAVNSVDWEGRVLYDSTGINASVDWNSGVLKDGSGANSIDWTGRQLRTSAGNRAFNWGSNDYVASSQIYQERTLSSEIQDNFSDILLTYSGQAISAAIDASSNIGELVYLQTNNIWYPVTQSLSNTSHMLGINLDGGSTILLEGDVVLDNMQAPAHGRPMYIKEGDVVPSSTQPTSGYVRVLGYCYYNNNTTAANWILKFKPSNDWYKI